MAENVQTIEFPDFLFGHDICNNDRAHMALPAAQAFHDAYYYHCGGEPLATVIRDLIVDLLHLHERLGPEEQDMVSTDRVLAVCADDYETERNEELPGCSGCDHTGYLLGQTYENIDWPDGWSPIQRCDTCDEFEGDDAAAEHYAHRFGTEFRWVDAEDDLPGDYIVRLPLCPETGVRGTSCTKPINHHDDCEFS